MKEIDGTESLCIFFACCTNLHSSAQACPLRCKSGRRGSENADAHATISTLFLSWALLGGKDHKIYKSNVFHVMSDQRGINIAEYISKLLSCLGYLYNKDKDLKMALCWEGDPMNPDKSSWAFLLVHEVIFRQKIQKDNKIECRLNCIATFC